MKDSKFIFLALTCYCLIAGIPFGSIAAGIPSSPSGLAVDAPVAVTPPGTGGLLSGMIPGNLRVPSGWTLVRATDFEGTKPLGESWTLWDSSVSSEKPHTGNKSIGGTYSRDQSFVGWNLSGSYVGTFSEIYISFYEYIESQARFNDELFLVSLMKRGPDGNSQDQHWFVDWFWAPAYNSTNATMYILGESNTANGKTYRRGAKGSAVGGNGQWVQWEVHYRQNTSGQLNGFCRVYRNGNLFTSTENQNMNGTVDMSNSLLTIGGVYTLLSWSTNYPTCTVAGSGIGSGTDACSNYMHWNGQSFSAPNLHPSLASFKRYFDDIVVMKK